MMMPATSPDPYLAHRRRMVEEQIRARGIRDPAVLDVLERVPRERFVPPEEVHEAFADRALPILCGQTISQPFMVAAMTAALKLRSTDRVLEIGTGSGYQTAVLASLARHVYTIERVAELKENTQRLMASLGYANVSFRAGDGTLGWPEEAPFDRILVTAGAPQVPPALIEQLADGGRLIIPVGSDKEQALTLVERRNGRVHEAVGIACRFVKLIGQQAWREGEIAADE